MLLYNFLALKYVALVIGVLYILTHLPGVLSPAVFTKVIRQFPRNYPLGVVLTLIGGIWFMWVTNTADLGELAPYRSRLMVVWATGTVLQILYMPAFLSVRGLAWIMLLAVNVILDAAFQLDTNTRLVMTALAYTWAIAAMIFVASPYMLRDLIDFTCKTETRCRAFCIPGVAFGVLLVGLALAFY